jgi:hypothetical protein
MASPVKLLKLLVPAAGVEPATSRSGGERSNPLSYAGLKFEKDSTQIKRLKNRAYSCQKFDGLRLQVKGAQVCKDPNSHPQTTENYVCE